MQGKAATKEQQEKLEIKKQYLKELGSVAVAFSSGVHSTFLVKVVHNTLEEKCIAVTAMSCWFPEREQLSFLAEGSNTDANGEYRSGLK